MLKITEKAEPQDFNDLVRVPGESYLNGLATLTKVNFTGHEYWRRSSEMLRKAYDGLCAYTSMHIEDVTGWKSVDHFNSKSDNPRDAYEWSNFRYVCGRMNGRKGKHTDVVDPFLIPEDLFYLDVPSFRVTVNPVHEREWGARAKSTIVRLKLNDEIGRRGKLQLAKWLVSGKVTMDFLSEYAPFFYRELIRQKIDSKELAIRIEQ